jgi:hypothetical protein
VQRAPVDTLAVAVQHPQYVLVGLRVGRHAIEPVHRAGVVGGQGPFDVAAVAQQQASVDVLRRVKRIPNAVPAR